MGREIVFVVLNWLLSDYHYYHMKLGKSSENLLKNYRLALKTHCAKKELDSWYITKK
jgi:hypothetical protein